MAILLLGGVVLHGYSEIEHEQDRLRSLETLHLGLGTGALTGHLEGISRDLGFLASYSALRLAVDQPTPENLAHLAADLANFSRNQGVYDQLRWLDETGMEMVRVDYVKGQPRVVAAAQLQSKSERYFFTDTIKLNAGQVYVSPLDLNVEQNQIELPHKPMLRVAAPIFNTAGKRRGIVILNYYGNAMLQGFASAAVGIADHAMVLNGAGYWLKSPEPADEWGFMYKRPDLTLGASAPQAWAQIRDADHGQTRLADGLWTWQSVYPLQIAQTQLTQASNTGASNVFASRQDGTGARQYVWKSVAHLPTATLDAVTQAVWLDLSATTLALLGVLGFGSWKLTQAWARQAATEDELRRSNAGLEQLVVERTQALVSVNEDLAQRESLLKQILDTSSVAIFLIDPGGCITQANQRMAEMFACPLETLIGREYVALVHPAEGQDARQNMRALQGSEIAQVDLDRRYQRSDKTGFWGHLIGKRFFDANGAERGFVGVIADITERKQAEEKLQLAASVFSHAREGIMITAVDGTIIDVNAAFSRITGYGRDEALGQNPRILRSDRHAENFYAAMWHDLGSKGEWDGEVWNRRKNGELYAQLQNISAVHDAQGTVLHYVALFSDITALKLNQQQLERIAHNDALTSLPNRVLLADRLHQAMAQALRRRQTLAVAYLDLDGFKVINDQYGHEVGDQLLIVLAGRMRQALREVDTLARIGGDEFVAVLLDLADISTSLPMITRLLAAAAQPVPVGGLVLQVSASLGVTFYPQGEDVDADQLLRQADQAMYQAKLGGKNRYHVFDAAQDSSIRGYHQSLERIRQALAEREFVFYYQPKVNLRTGAVLGVEALIRWQHPEKGLLTPAAFLPLIENHALAIDIGEWAIATALTQMAAWQVDGLSLPVSVNIGARQLQQADFVARLQEILARHPKIRPGDLELEVMETSALKDLTHVCAVIEACREIGVTFALDDFGTGYSSLTYLKQLRVNRIKIDRIFTRNLLDDPDDLAILEGVLGLAAAFHRQVIAQGVETVAHGTLLLQLGYELAQGYGIARPMPAQDLPGWVAAWQPDPAWVDLPLLTVGSSLAAASAPGS